MIQSGDARWPHPQKVAINGAINTRRRYTPTRYEVQSTLTTNRSMEPRDIIYHCANVMREHLRKPGSDLDNFFRGALDRADEYLAKKDVVNDVTK